MLFDHSPRAVGTEADAMKCTAQFGLILGVTLQVAQLVSAMSELALITVFAFTSFLKWTTQLGLVAVNGDKERLKLGLLSA
jgi:hypothetical protein